jgi:hypothetical protein
MFQQFFDGFPKEGISMAQMQSLKPARKVWAGAAVGALVTIIVWLIETIGKITIPAGVVVAMNTVLAFIVS